VETDPEIWAEATLLIARHGGDAATRAAMKADQLSDVDHAGRRRWLRIVQAIEWLQDRRGRNPFKKEH
jgi:hypothetical protein